MNPFSICRSVVASMLRVTALSWAHNEAAVQRIDAPSPATRHRDGPGQMAASAHSFRVQAPFRELLAHMAESGSVALRGVRMRW